MSSKPRLCILHLCETETNFVESIAFVIVNFIAEAGVNLIIYHGGVFVRTPMLVYMEGEMSSCYVDPDMLSVGDLKGIVDELGYAEHRIRRLH